MVFDLKLGETHYLQESDCGQQCGEDVDGVGDVDQGCTGVLQSWPGLDGRGVDVEDEDVEDHGQDGHGRAAPEAHPHPPRLPGAPGLLWRHVCVWLVWSLEEEVESFVIFYYTLMCLALKITQRM